MANIDKDFTGVLSPNQYGQKYSGNFPTGNRPVANYNLFFKEDFSSYPINQPFPGFHTSSVVVPSAVPSNTLTGFAASVVSPAASPFLNGNALRVGIQAMTPPVCGGSQNYGGRKTLSQPIPYGSRVWFSMRLFHPKNQTWGYCYDAGDSAAAAVCGKTADGNEWLKFMVMAPSSGTARIYLQPKSLKGVTAQSQGIRLYSEYSQTPFDAPTTRLPLGRWYTLQMELSLNSNGYIRYWIDNDYIGQDSSPPVAPGESINEWGIGDYWNGAPFTDGLADEYFFVKDVMIATNAPGFLAPTETDAQGRLFIAPFRTPRDFA